MAGTADGARRAAAARLGMSAEDYLERVTGEKWCGHCRAWHDQTAFTVDRSRGDGLSARCRLRSARREPGPDKLARRQARARGAAWCRRCCRWHPLADVRAGLCREHRNEVYRENYAASGGAYKRGQSAARRRGVAAVGPSTREWLLFEATGGKCAYGCDRPAVGLDHVLPVARGGLTERGNMVPACTPCNSAKRDSDPRPWIDRMTPEAFDLILPTATDDGPLFDLLVS